MMEVGAIALMASVFSFASSILWRTLSPGMIGGGLGGITTYALCESSEVAKVAAWWGLAFLGSLIFTQ